MQNPDFTFLTRPQARHARWWLILGTISLAIAGIFSIVPVASRTPAIAALPQMANIFHASIVVHVDMSMLAWFLCFACMIWSLATRRRILMLEESALISMAIGMALIALSPFDTKAEPYMSNYIPVIHSPVFFVGLVMIGCSVLFMALNILFCEADNFFIKIAVRSSALIAIIALGAFYASYRAMPAIIEGQQYYEMLFWGGGHVLQYLHVQLLLVAWLYLCPLPGNKFLPALFLITVAAALLTPFGYMHEVTSFQHRQFFTHMMIGAGGLAPAILAFFIIPKLWRMERNALWAALCASIALFLIGGLMGHMIQGQNVVIPAHYHGSIIGITIAFMGACYALLPAFGYRDVKQWKLAFWQPFIYCAGQLMHITGLAISGGYGVLRKTPGAMESQAGKAAMGLMGLGGLLAAIGGLFFIIVVYKSIRGGARRA